MTVIIGMVYGNKVYMAGDSLGVSSYDKVERDDPKVFKNDKFLIGFTTSFRMGQLLQYKFKPPKQKPKQSDHEYMVTDFIDAVRKVLNDNGYGEKDKNQETGGQFLVGYKSALYQIDSDYQVGIPTDQYAAIGCGAAYAIGALHGWLKDNDGDFGTTTITINVTGLS